MNHPKAPQGASIRYVLSVFNSDAGTPVTHDTGTHMVALADGKSAYGRALRDVTAVALSGRWLDENGNVLSDNAIGHALGVAMRQPRARLAALTGSGLSFHSDQDIKDNAAVWVHVSKMYNAGKPGRDQIKGAVEKIALITEIDEKRAAWLATPVPPRVENKRDGNPNDGTSSQDDAADGNAPSGTAERFPIGELDTGSLLAYLSSIGAELASRVGDMTVAERAAFRDAAASLVEAAKATAKR